VPEIEAPRPVVSPAPCVPVPAPVEPAPAAGSSVPVTSHYITVYGANLHYREAGAGEGETVLFLHGNPASSFLWRNILPEVGRCARCIALDLVGMGKSDKPDIPYRLLDHYKYVEGFVELLGLRDITLVVHDWGSALGFLLARRAPEKVKRIAFMEALLKTYPSWDTFPRAGAPPQIAALFRSCRGDAGRATLVDSDTNFIDLLVRPVLGVELPMEDLNEYWLPFMNREYREPVWRWPNEIPVANDPPDTALLVDEYAEALKQSPVPKLLIYHPNGVITADPEVEWSRANLKNLSVVKLEGCLAGPIHFLQERFPREIAEALSNWLQRP